MSIIDAHVHLYPPQANRDPAAWAAGMSEPHWAVMCARRRKNGQPVQAFPGVGELLREMDLAGVERAVLLGWYWNHAATCAVQNRFYAECVRAHPDRLSAFATLNPAAGREVTVGELRRAHADGLAGLGELSPHSQGYRVDDPVFRRVLEIATELHWPVNLHVTDPKGAPYPGRVETPLADFVRLAADFPGVNFILAHWGGLLPLAASPESIPGNIYYDTAASPLLYDAEIWSRFQGRASLDRVIFGSDFPLNLYPRSDAAPAMKRFLDEAGQAGATAAVMGANAARLLGIPGVKGPV
ncbi:MAG TPA: amidohydrolase family protein [Opitutaceae bacterium]|nr:amidohydrolase family protein [Opitutaceae bacterium]